MKTIPVPMHVIEEAEFVQYDESYYPTDGLYLWAVVRTLIVVDRGTVSCLCVLSTDAMFKIMKSIDAAQQPELIKEI